MLAELVVALAITRSVATAEIARVGGHYTVQGEQIIILVPVESPHATSNTDLHSISHHFPVKAHLPLTVKMQGRASNLDNELNYDSKPKQLQLTWDRGDTMSFYQHIGHFLTPLLTSVEEMLLACSDNNIGERHQRLIWPHLSIMFTVK